MKTTKNTKKTIKSIKPAFTVDITNCETDIDVIIEIAIAKVDAGIAITREELETIIFNEVELALEEYVEDIENEIVVLTDVIEMQEAKNNTKKPNIFKRFWNWITRK